MRAKVILWALGVVLAAVNAGFAAYHFVKGDALGAAFHTGITTSLLMTGRAMQP